MILADGLAPDPEEMTLDERGARARIQVAVHDDGRWMWATDVMAGNSGAGYWIGPKWNNFTDSREDAIEEAITEISQFIDRNSESGAAPKIRAWLETVRMPPQLNLFGQAA